ncbi:MAG: cation:proton antiporter, partial [Roseibacillus sp.]|nr:cation:proton antiporter [Roseibacillus sp.]
MTPLAYLALVLALGILAQWLAWRLKLPSILILLAFGFGLSLTTGVRIDDYLERETLLALVGIFVAIILFEGGLTLKFSELREAGAPVIRL